ncbi:MerR family transcriptional regulator [Aurantiacibacter suaedae]|uniref:MerR family transcriptional regulator n=1 Tax=Aurantiacibacter suaedae TaxID=2545755 RepID=UPI001F4F2962|nr:MerR family transcriptional regulator [Aurantiacibacter suaedae]
MRTIGEVCEALGLKPHVLRYWEQQFPMLNPLKRSGGRRLYRAEDIALVSQIDRLVNAEGYTLKGARSVLEGKQPAAEDTTAQHRGSAQAAEVDDDLLEGLHAVRAKLARSLGN